MSKQPSLQNGVADAAAGKRKLTVLVIDDAEEVVATLKDYLSACGHTALTALCGTDGLRQFRENRVDVVLCDLAMPGMTGWDVGKAIKRIAQENGFSKPPFILVTGWSDEISDDKRVAECAVDAVMGKPVDLGRLSALLIHSVAKLLPSDRAGQDP